MKAQSVTLIAVAIFAAAVLLGFIFVRGSLVESGSSGSRTPQTEQPSPVVGSTLLRPADSASRTAPGTPAPSGDVALAHSADERAASLDAGKDAWGIVARLEDLAREPRTFHAAALPVIELLTKTCSIDVQNRSRMGASATTPIVQDLLQKVVSNPDRTTLVRGAVFLSLASLLTESEFWGTFTAWYSARPSAPLELLRTAALAASRIGSPSPCGSSVSLKRLAALQTEGAATLPSCYPIVLDRLASERACDSIRAWLDADDPRRDLFRLSAGAPPADFDPASAQDYFVTVEILFCVWGQQCLQDPGVEREVLREAFLESDKQEGRSVLFFRAANFLVFSLARCNDSLRNATLKVASSQDPILVTVARSMESMVDGIGLANLATIERLRYSSEPVDVATLALILVDIGKGLGDLHSLDGEQLTTALDYLGGLVGDVGIDEKVRATALNVVARSGSWPAFKRLTAACLESDPPELVAATAFTTLMAEARSDPSRRVDAAQLLMQLSDDKLSTGMRSAVDEYIAKLRN